MNRRELLAMTAAAGIAGATTAMGDEPTSPIHHDHGAMMGKYDALLASTSHCVDSGDRCLSHCLDLLATGEKEMAACAKTVRDVIAACESLRQLAAANSPHTAKMARLVGEICKDCETECRKHEKKHSVCHDCAEACAQCAHECEKAAA